MKIAIAIATKDALHSAFVVFRGIEESIKKASDLGYDGVELALMHKDQIDINKVKKLISQYSLQIPVISTGQVFAGLNLSFTDPDIEVRNKVKEVIIGLIDTASEFGAKVNFGRVRGSYSNDENRDITEERFIDTVSYLSEYGRKLGVELLIEPVNRYEINFLNSVDEGSKLIKKINDKNVKLMPDIFHMNIEDQSIVGSLIKHIDEIGYIHFADSNRFAPGYGHLHFPEIINALKALDYNNWISVEILPMPDPYTAAKQSIDYLRKII